MPIFKEVCTYQYFQAFKTTKLSIKRLKTIYFKKQCSSSSFLLVYLHVLIYFTYTYFLIIQIQDDHGVLTQQAGPCFKCIEFACQVLHGYLELVFLLQVSKNDDEEHCFLK